MDKRSCLVLGGSYYIGKAFVTALQGAKTHSIYMANRGTQENNFDGITFIELDRLKEDTCKKLKNYTFQIVIDFSCLTTAMFKHTARNINCDYYVFISSGLADLRDKQHADYDYGRNKRYSEKLVKKFCNKNLIVRPGYVVGEGDYTNRFERKDKLPLYSFKGTTQCVSQFIDVEFLASSLVNMIHYQETGVVKLGYV